MNLAARLEGINKQFGTLILMGENTYTQVKRDVVAREVDVVRVAGKHNPTRIFELVGLPGQVDTKALELIAIYERGLEFYRARAFQKAIEVFDRALLLNPHDGPSHTLRSRCEKFLVSPPAEAWDGVTELEK